MLSTLALRVSSLGVLRGYRKLNGLSTGSGRVEPQPPGTAGQAKELVQAGLKIAQRGDLWLCERLI